MAFKACIWGMGLAMAAGFTASTVKPVQAQYCEGTVHSLSGSYNLAKGTGFLAVRARPNSSSRMVAQLFNGDTVEITDSNGRWYFIGGDGFEGWAHSKWMRNSCSD